MLVWEKKTGIIYRRRNIVSILVLLDAGLGDPTGTINMSVFPRFNPCFVGCWSGRKTFCNPRGDTTKFQSLFCWMLVWEEIVSGSFVCVRNVSILVLLDAGLGDISDPLSGSSEICFNPCFVGCWSGRRQCLGMLDEQLSFNPCFVGCWSGRGITLILSVSGNEFQSLFCWMLVWEATLKNGTKNSSVVSILVLLDAGLGEIPPIARRIINGSFNPCFVGCWSGRWLVATVACAMGCFNPCFVGCWSGSFFSVYFRFFEFLFQSLFCWMLVWETMRTTPTTPKTGVSILVLLDAGLGAVT